MKRRNFVRNSVGIGIVGAVSTGAVPASATAGPDGSITFQEQTIDGTSIVVEEISTDIDATIGVINQDADETAGFESQFGPEIEPGTYTEFEIGLSPPLTESAELAVSLYDEDGQGFARDLAVVDIPEDIEFVEGVEPTLIDADPAAGFEYPYLLYAPFTTTGGEPKPLLTEPTNTGQRSDDLGDHLEAGEFTVEHGLGREVADQLELPLVVPVFPRPMEEPVDGSHYVHALDDTTMSLDGGPLERVDLQLLSMVEHAQAYLADQDYPISTEGVLLNGFSASGNFVERFTVLHPEEVISVTAGGLNGMPLLPLESFRGRELPYHVGIADIEQLTGKTPDLDALDETNQFLYMGAEDDNDTIPFGDAWTDDELRQLALDVYGEDMIAERFPASQQAFQEAGVEAQFRVYADAGHTTRPATDDVIEFHRRSINGEDVSDFGETIAPTLHIDASETTVSVGEEIEFDASDSTVMDEVEILTHQWDFDDGSDATGATSTHSYDEEGLYTVTLTLITDAGNEHHTVQEIEVVGDGDDEPAADDGTSDGDDENTGDGDDENTAEGDDESTADGDRESDDEDAAEGDDVDATDADDDGAGFGVGGAVASIGGVAYLLKRRFDATDSEAE